MLIAAASNPPLGFSFAPWPHSLPGPAGPCRHGGPGFCWGLGRRLLVRRPVFQDRVQRHLRPQGLLLRRRRDLRHGPRAMCHHSHAAGNKTSIASMATATTTAPYQEIAAARNRSCWGCADAIFDGCWDKLASPAECTNCAATAATAGVCTSDQVALPARCRVLCRGGGVRVRASRPDRRRG